MNKAVLSLVLFLAVCMGIAPAVSYGGNETMTNKKFPHIDTSDSIRHIVNHPAFKGFAQCILPWDDNRSYYDTPLGNVSSLMPYHSHVIPEIVLNALNHMIDEVGKGETIFYDFYTEQQKLEDPSKKTTGLFFFKGKPGAPFAVICPGGGFSYVGSLHEGFPHALELSNKGYNAFVLRYRTGSGARATQDLMAAIAYILKNAQMFEVSSDNYSLWGSSAGARMVGDFASYGYIDLGGVTMPRPRAVMIIYTGHTSVSDKYPPAFIIVSKDDPIVNASVVDRRVEALRDLGIKVEYRKYDGAGHGFGLGDGTDADGWLEKRCSVLGKLSPAIKSTS